MNNKVKEVLQKLEDNGFEAYVVGGYPRDFLLNIETSDFDICTSAKKEDLECIFDMKLDDNYGSINLNYQGIKFEITTYRKELKYEGVRTPNFIYTDKLEEDILRRDFTINTICMNYKEELIDILDGQEDIHNKIIRCVGNADEKISEDPLRILRAIRFACILNFSIDKELEKAILLNGHKVKNLSYFRKKQELDKIFSSINVNRGVTLLKKYNLEEYLDIKIDKVVVSSYLGVWSQIEYSNHYPFNKKEKDEIKNIKNIVASGKITSHHLYLYGIDISLIAGRILGMDEENIRKLYLELPIKNRNEMDITYDEIIKNSKISVNKIYSILEYEILNNSLSNNKNDIINYIKNL